MDNGGGIIKRESIMAVLLLLTIALPFSASTAFATSNITNASSSQVNTSSSNVTNVTNTSTSKSTDNTTTNQSTTTQATNKSTSVKAAGSAASTSTNISFTSSQINNAATRVVSFIETNKRLPNYVTIGTTQVSMAQFLELLVENLLNYNNGISTSLTLDSVKNASSTSDNVTSGKIQKSEYLSIAKSILKTINSTGTAPSSVTTSLGKMKFQNLVYTFSKIISFKSTNNRLPNYVSVKSWSTITSTTSTASSSVQAILDAIGKAEAKFADVQGQSSATVMEEVGYGDCWADSSWLYAKLTAAGIKARIMEATDSSGLYYLHRWIQINIGNGWVNWDYAGYNSQHYGELGSGSYVYKTN